MPSLWRKIFGFVFLAFLLPAGAGAEHDIRLSEDVNRTKHNLLANPDITATGTNRVCVFCHTPHGANDTAPGHAPLWNRLLPDDSNYEVFQSPSFDAVDLTGTRRPKGVSLACLSCHDGGIALDSMINAPRSGGYIPSNSGVGDGPGTSSPLINFLAGGIVDGDSSFTEGPRDATEVQTTDESAYSGGIHDLVRGAGAATEGAQPFPNLGYDLMDDHPIGMEIPCLEDPQFSEICRDLTSAKLDGGKDGTSVAFISRTTASESMVWPMEKRDRLRAYPSTDQAGRYFVECASCHNPHAPRVSFLRLPSGVPGLVTTNLHPTDSVGNPNGKTWGQRPNAASAIC
ncbi:MAG TPA: hypothetical protein VLB09_02625, partial [Nitrospiria bacterium]|nr:hypothetical protein [Nitrospiria bacterium]